MAISVTVRFATNRNQISDHEFGSGFRDGNPKHYVTGSVKVTRWSPDLPDSGWKPEYGTMQLDPPSDAGDLFKAPLGSNHLAAFARDRSTARKKLARRAPSYGLILLPGFASTFEDALARAGQVATAYQAEEVFVFSWPTNGKVDLDSYKKDQVLARKSAASIAHSLLHMLKFMVTTTPATRPPLNIVAHSMGNYALRHAIQAIVKKDPSLIKPDLLAGALLMAADEADDTLSRKDGLQPLQRLAKRTTVYHSAGDLALGASRLINGWSPLGLFRPRKLTSLPKTTTAVNCSDVASTQDDNGHSHFGHQYYRLSPWVINDVVQVLADIAPNKIRGRLRDPFDPAGDQAWWIPYDTGAGAAKRKSGSGASARKRRSKKVAKAKRRKR